MKSCYFNILERMIEMSIHRLLDEEIQNELVELKKMKLGDEEYKTTVDGLTKLVDRSIEMEKLDIEKQEKAENQEIDNSFKLKQMDEDRKDRIVKNCITIAGIAIPSIITIWGTIKSFEFEKEGTITTIMGRGFINKLLPNK